MGGALPDFPKVVSLTVTNQCNLRCTMCAQWSEEGYMRGRDSQASFKGSPVPFDSLLRVVDEVAERKVPLLIRGGEPLLYPRIMELLTYIKAKGIHLSFETNAVLLKKYAEEFVKLRIDNLTVSVDGPEEVHDFVRGVKGAFTQLRESLEELERQEKAAGSSISRGITCTLSRYNYRSLGQMPDVARSLGFKTICIVPYYYIPEKIGLAYAKLMRDRFNCEAFSWRGFHHEDSGVDMKEFIVQLKEFKSKLGDIESYPYMPLTDKEYTEWFTKSDTTVRQATCNNISGLLDVQPDGSVDFCVDFPDYAIGNIQDASLYDLWHSDRARAFREQRSEEQMPVCYRCGSKYMV